MSDLTTSLFLGLIVFISGALFLIVQHLQADAEPAEVRSANRVRDIQGIVAGNALLHRPNVVFTPHIAFNSVEAVEKLHRITVENVQAFVAGKPQNVA